MVRTFKPDPKSDFRATLERGEEFARNMVSRQDAEPLRTRTVPSCYVIKDVGNDKPYRVVVRPPPYSYPTIRGQPSLDDAASVAYPPAAFRRAPTGPGCGLWHPDPEVTRSGPPEREGLLSGRRA